MIASMLKAYVVARAGQKERLLTALRQAGVVHLHPVDPAEAQPDEATRSAIQRIARAEQLLASVTPAGETPALAPLPAADRVLELANRATESIARLASLHREAEQLAPWGDVRLADIEALREAGIELLFVTVAGEEADQIQAPCVETLANLPGKRRLLAIAYYGDQSPALPASAQPLELPPRDRPAVREEARQIDQALHADREELARLAQRLGALAQERHRLEQQDRYMLADRGGLSAQEGLFAIQGWVPKDQAQKLAGTFEQEGLDVAVQLTEPQDDEQPPTLVRYPRWTRPIIPLFKMLGTVPGYREFDVSGVFMFFLPIFTAIMIGDAGYGMLLTAISLGFWGKLAKKIGPEILTFILIVGLCSIVWGGLIGSYFGLNPEQLAGLGSVGSAIASAVGWAWQIYDTSPAQPDFAAKVTRLVFVLGAVHMTLGRLWQAWALRRQLVALSHVGWAIFLWGTLFLVQMLVLNDTSHITLMKYLLAGGGAMIVLFTITSGNPLKRVGLGLVSSFFPAVGALGDTISYIRLMAVLLASGALAYNFDMLAAQVSVSATWAVGALILIFAHSLNMALAVLAFFAHGVRLNMLEFSNHSGMSWSGYPYEPFSTRPIQER